VHHRRLFAPVAAAREKHEAMAMAGALLADKARDGIEVPAQLAG
jgi:hypothetical protein